MTTRRNLSPTLPAVLLALSTLLLLPSCTLHLCGTAKETPRETDYDFPKVPANSETYTVAVTKGSGKPILVLHGLGGLDPATLEWAQHLQHRGWKVYLPMLDAKFGKCEVPQHQTALSKNQRWHLDDPSSAGPILEDMSKIADWISSRNGSRPIVAVGNCLTGSLPLALLPRKSVKSAVLCQPALPLKNVGQTLLGIPQSKTKRQGLAIPDQTLDATIVALRKDPGKRLIGFHYLDDPLASMEKFNTLHNRLSRANLAHKFEAVVIIPDDINNNDRSTYWWPARHELKTKIKPTRLKPHMTLTGSEMEDRQMLREKFDQMVKP